MGRGIRPTGLWLIVPQIPYRAFIMNGKTILHYLNTNFRRTAQEADGIFAEALEGPERVLRCCSEEMIETAKAACLRQETTPIKEGREDREKMFLSGLEFTWLESERIWSFRGEFYSIEVMTTCCQEDVTAWLEAFFVAESEGGGLLLDSGARLIHILGVTFNDSLCVAISTVHEAKIEWSNLAGENRLCAAALIHATKDSAHPLQLRRLIHHLWITMKVRAFNIRETFVEDHGGGDIFKRITHLHAFRALSNEPRFDPTPRAALLTPGVSYETDTPFARVQVSAEVDVEDAQKLFGMLAEQSELFAKLGDRIDQREWKTVARYEYFQKYAFR